MIYKVYKSRYKSYGGRDLYFIKGVKNKYISDSIILKPYLNKYNFAFCDKYGRLLYINSNPKILQNLSLYTDKNYTNDTYPSLISNIKEPLNRHSHLFYYHNLYEDVSREIKNGKLNFANAVETIEYRSPPKKDINTIISGRESTRSHIISMLGSELSSYSKIGPIDPIIYRNYIKDTNDVTRILDEAKELGAKYSRKFI